MNELPGQFPFTRGIQPSMYRTRLWTMRQYAGFGTAEESNKRYHYLLKHGQKGLSIAFDLPTQMGFDSDHPMSHGEVGKVGVSIDTLDDMKLLLKGIPLGEVSTSMTINATASILLCLYMAVAKSKNIPLHTLQGTIQNDILKEYIARGTYIYPPQASLRIITDIFKFCKKSLPLWNTISISGYHIREAGSTAVQEVAFTLANGITYVEAALKAGLQIDEFAPRLSFFFNVHNNFLEEIAKFRAARRLWAKIVKERFKAKEDRSLMLRFHAQTAGCSLTAQQPLNNITRVTLQALAAVLGGTQSLHTNSFDEALSLPTEEAVRIALRTQQIIADETGVINTVDPVGGSEIIEHLTNEIEEKALAYIQKIDEQGGVIACIQNGYLQREIQASSFEYQKKVEAKEEIIVGVNKFTIEKEEKIKTQKISPTLEKKQIEKLKKFKKSRSSHTVAHALSQIKKGAASKENLIPAILEAVESYATLGEISDAMREVFGTYKENVTL
ncbi:MAG: methylmalonyl-CoA mutase [Deltaproteobacteria bacterium GWA2_38_16]|nr:MAG: methylmalonyl-CoA mutase [Deltaproteobacteria bacterium GWA2_38_16]OGQ02918.1 MAG: methylmalonyl-CoA mutase [Deltaproteobacteria bacterium RIFCSPHIGHO2_02_FULL_38_15]HBQ21766.1 methylmalonyl-CoA mutase [Deltaproteobacteria bacterium]